MCNVVVPLTEAADKSLEKLHRSESADAARLNETNLMGNVICQLGTSLDTYNITRGVLDRFIYKIYDILGLTAALVIHNNFDHDNKLLC
jgi:hypothetical protein